MYLLCDFVTRADVEKWGREHATLPLMPTMKITFMRFGKRPGIKLSGLRSVILTII